MVHSYNPDLLIFLIFLSDKQEIEQFVGRELAKSNHNQFDQTNTKICSYDFHNPKPNLKYNYTYPIIAQQLYLELLSYALNFTANLGLFSTNAKLL